MIQRLSSRHFRRSKKNSNRDKEVQGHQNQAFQPDHAHQGDFDKYFQAPFAIQTGSASFLEIVHPQNK